MDNVKLFREVKGLINNIGTQSFLIKSYDNRKNARHIWYKPQEHINKLRPLLYVVEENLGNKRVITGHLVNTLYGINVKTLQGLSNPNNTRPVISRASKYNEFRESDVINYVLFIIWYKIKRCVVGLPILTYKGKLYGFPSRRDLFLYDLFRDKSWLDKLKEIGVGDSILNKLISCNEENNLRAKRGLIC